VSEEGLKRLGDDGWRTGCSAESSAWLTLDKKPEESTGKGSRASLLGHGARQAIKFGGTPAKLETHDGGFALRLQRSKSGGGVLAARWLEVLHGWQRGVAEEGAEFYSNSGHTLARNPEKFGILGNLGAVSPIRPR
jgi:hypothetical protein